MLQRGRSRRSWWEPAGAGAGAGGERSAPEERLLRARVPERELARLRPERDVPPADSLLLRMELRTALVRDSHTHAAIQKRNFKSKLQRNKTMKDISRVNKEITKIKNNLNNKNIENCLMLKHSTKIRKNLKNVIKVYPKKDGVFNFVDEEISFISELENNLNSEREILSGVDQEPIIQTNNFKADKEITCMKNEDFNKQFDDLQATLTLMAITSINYEEKLPTDNLENNEVMSSFSNDSDILDDNLKIVAISSESTQDNNFLKIKSLTNMVRQDFLSKKYFNKWKIYIQTKKGMSEMRKSTLNSFFEKLMQRKCELKKNSSQDDKNKLNKAHLIARDQTSYQRRYQVQKNIIALQKLKLEEQNKIIEELKYNKIVEASRESVEAMREELRTNYADIDRKMKPKMRCLMTELKLHEIEEPALVLHCLKVPQFLQRMEKRAREREEKHAIIRERRRQMEEEKMRIKQQAEVTKADMDKEEKTRRIKELKAKRRQEKIDNIRRKQYAERMRAFRVMADLHYERNLVWRCGLEPWKKLIEMKYDNLAKAVAHCDFQLKKNVLLNWMWHAEDMWMERNYKSEDHYRKKILKKYFDAFKKNHHELVLKKQVADDYYDLYVCQLVFRKFRENVSLLKKENNLKWQTAVKYYESNIMFRALTHWRMLPALNKLQREREARKTRWRQKVLQVVPDYTPPQDY